MFCSTNNLSVIINKLDILKDIAINIESNKTTAIIGKNGSGKTTLLRCINCLFYPTSGYFKHKFNYPFPMLFQKPAIFDNTVKYNFEILSKIKKIKPILKWYNSFNLDKIANKNIYQISGGELQKTYLSRIMSIETKVLIMDEPNQNLDKENEKKLTELIIDEKNKNKTIIFTTHDINIVKETADKLIVLDSGKIDFDGIPNNFFKI